MNGTTPHSAYGTWLVALAALVGFAISIFEDVSPGTGIGDTGGIYLVIISTALMVVAAGAILLWPAMRRWLRELLLGLVLLDIAGTGLAAYMLDAWWLVGAMAVGLVGWIIHVAADPAPKRVAAGV